MQSEHALRVKPAGHAWERGPVGNAVHLLTIGWTGEKFEDPSKTYLHDKGKYFRHLYPRHKRDTE